MKHAFFCLLALGIATTTATAQCFETNFGALMPRGTNAPGIGDDYLFDLQPMSDGLGGGIASFTIGAVPTAYTHVHVQTNGVMFLTTGAASGATTTGYSTTAATMITNLSGTAGQPPRLAVYWRDLNILAANQGGVYLNNSLPGKLVVTWANAVHYGQSAPVFTVQAQLYADGHVDFHYSATAQNTAVSPLLGLSEGNAVADPGATDLSVGAVGVSTSQMVYEVFATASTLDLADHTVSFVPNGIGGFDTVTAGCVVAGTTRFGQGCLVRKTSLYESFATGGTDLGTAAGTNSLLFMPNGNGGYVTLPGSGGFFTPVAADLALGDDALSVQQLPVTFPFCSGLITSIAISSNGFVWLDSAQTSADYSPSVSELLTLAPRLAVQWGDLSPNMIDPVTTLPYGSVHFDVDAVTNDAIVTWLNVPQYNTAAAPQLNTFQLVLSPSGAIEYRYQACASTNAVLVGLSEGMAAQDPGMANLTDAWTAPLDTGARLLALDLDASARPVLGAGPINLVVDNLAATAPFGALFLSFTRHEPGIDLAPLGMPTCWQYVDFDAVLPFVPAGTTTALPLQVPNTPALSGLPFQAQAAAVANGVNAAGVTTSNGLSLRLGIL